MNNLTRNNHTNAITDTTDNNQETVLILCIADNFYTKKPTFNEQTKTLHIFANKNIVLRAKERVTIVTDESFYLSDYLYNYWTISSKYMGTYLIIEVNALNERSLNQKLKVTLKNYSIFTYRISKDDEIGEITFVTEKKINYQLTHTCEINFDPLSKKVIQKYNDNNKKLIT